MIILMFGPRDLASVLAHASLHSVIGLTLPPIDANPLHQLFGLSGRLEKMSVHGLTLLFFVYLFCNPQMNCLF